MELAPCVEVEVSEVVEETPFDGDEELVSDVEVLVAVEPGGDDGNIDESGS